MHPVSCSWYHRRKDRDKLKYLETNKTFTRTEHWAHSWATPSENMPWLWREISFYKHRIEKNEHLKKEHFKYGVIGNLEVKWIKKNKKLRGSGKTEENIVYGEDK